MGMAKNPSFEVEKSEVRPYETRMTDISENERRLAAMLRKTYLWLSDLGLGEEREECDALLLKIEAVLTETDQLTTAVKRSIKAFARARQNPYDWIGSGD